MDFTITGLFVRSASFELANGDIYETAAPYRVELDGKQILSGLRKNVFSVYGLKPNTQYRVSVCTDGETVTKAFTTQNESFRLNVRDFGARGDGTTLDTAAIQAAILCCPPDGTVLIPRGTFYTSALFLKSRITIELAPGAVLLGAAERSLYPVLPGVVRAENERDECYLGIWEGNPLSSFASLLTGVGVSHVSIVGTGVLDANAQNGDWWQSPKKKRVAWRPRMLFLNRCEDIRVQGVTFRNSYAWTIHPCFSRGISLIDIKVLNSPDSPNTDGLDIESCDKVDVIGAEISVGDDCIALKSCKLFLGRQLKLPACNIEVRNCLLKRGHGAIVIGSETSAGVYNITAEQCVFDGTDRGLRIKTRRGRGDLSVIDGILLKNIRMSRVSTPFVINMFYFCDPDGHSEPVWSKEKKPVDSLTPKVGSLKCENVRCEDCSVAGMFFYGLPEMPIESIEMDDISIGFSGKAQPGYPDMMDHIKKVKRLGIYANNVKRLRLRDVSVSGSEGEPVTVRNVENLVREGRNNA